MIGLHVCQGNYQSKWIAAGGYDLTAEAMFTRMPNIGVFLLEYEDERSGSFEPLAKMPDDNKVVLGLVSSKTTEVETAETIKARIAEAARYVGKDRLAVHPVWVLLGFGRCQPHHRGHPAAQAGTRRPGSRRGLVGPYPGRPRPGPARADAARAGA